LNSSLLAFSDDDDDEKEVDVELSDEQMLPHDFVCSVFETAFILENRRRCKHFICDEQKSDTQ
jgi:hypothetical protein